MKAWQCIEALLAIFPYGIPDSELTMPVRCMLLCDMSAFTRFNTTLPRAHASRIVVSMLKNCLSLKDTIGQLVLVLRCIQDLCTSPIHELGYPVHISYCS